MNYSELKSLKTRLATAGLIGTEASATIDLQLFEIRQSEMKRFREKIRNIVNDADISDQYFVNALRLEFSLLPVDCR